MPIIAGTAVSAAPQKGYKIKVEMIAISNPKETVNELRKYLRNPGIRGIRQMSFEVRKFSYNYKELRA